jgi:hypothetical protein
MEFLDGYAHSGMVRSAERILAESGRILKKAFEIYSGYRFVITGHSLGGGTAILTTMLVLSRDDIVDPKKIKVKLNELQRVCHFFHKSCIYSPY